VGISGAYKDLPTRGKAYVAMFIKALLCGRA